MAATEPRLGIDIGRVIIDGSRGVGGDTAFFNGDEAAMLSTPAVPGAIEAVARLADRFGGRVWLVSKCGPRVQERTRRWLLAHDFHRRTGVPPTHLCFCRARRDKRAICERLGLTHFVDDHHEVHASLLGAVEHQYFFGAQARPVPAYGRHAPTWADVERLIEGSLGLERTR